MAMDFSSSFPCTFPPRATSHCSSRLLTSTCTSRLLLLLLSPKAQTLQVILPSSLTIKCMHDPPLHFINFPFLFSVYIHMILRCKSNLLHAVTLILIWRLFSNQLRCSIMDWWQRLRRAWLAATARLLKARKNGSCSCFHLLMLGSINWINKNFTWVSNFWDLLFFSL